MQLSMKLRCLLLILPLLLSAVPVRADIASPERIRRQAEVRDWRRRFPNLEPDLELGLTPDGKALLLNLTFRSPADYIIRVDGKERGRGRVNEPGGASRTEQVALPPPPERKDSIELKVDYTLYGVENTRFGPKLTDRSITGCAIRRFAVDRQDGRAQLREVALDGGDYFALRQCGL